MGDEREKRRVPVDGGRNLTQNPFGALESAGLPPGPAEGESTGGATAPTSGRKAPNRNRGRVDITRQTAHRGGKVVTVISGFVGIGAPEKEQLAKAIQQACGTGGTVKEGRIEIQGDRRSEAAKVLADAGFRPVMAGG
ncbi:MAG TPA: translation initiation factor [Verrucomicrobiales bacterium]|nr:translation initiation factor [Verrucomicrobiales bacterium]